MLRKYAVSPLLAVCLISPALVQRGGAALHGHNCSRLSWCLGSACPNERTGAERACHLANAGRKAACALIKISPIPAVRRTHKLCVKLQKRDHKCCMARAKNAYNDCRRTCCRVHFPTPPESCPVTEARCRGL